MEDLKLEGSPKTPHIDFSSNDGTLVLKGRSIPENSIEFYEPIFQWLDNYGKSPKGETQVKVLLEYFNTSSSKCILDFFRKLEQINKSGKSKVKIDWYYESDDEDMEEVGTDYQSILDIEINMVSVDELE